MILFFIELKFDIFSSSLVEAFEGFAYTKHWSTGFVRIVPPARLTDNTEVKKVWSSSSPRDGERMFAIKYRFSDKNSVFAFDSIVCLTISLAERRESKILLAN